MKHMFTQGCRSTSRICKHSIITLLTGSGASWQREVCSRRLEDQQSQMYVQHAAFMWPANNSGLCTRLVPQQRHNMKWWVQEKHLCTHTKNPTTWLFKKTLKKKEKYLLTYYRQQSALSFTSSMEEGSSSDTNSILSSGRSEEGGASPAAWVYEGMDVGEKPEAAAVPVDSLKKYEVKFLTCWVSWV